ncbi:hypothetical protein AUJ65_05280 [Candidatus Micrarchaeota archaeon CG1_02_51_15]|nr:MAG: hypothetical protein AUJ65_05280 [Candidatus Micrarchaeota archaeon CG1_02_51_15]
MKKVLFLVTELQKPVGGLYRYATELFPAWKHAVEQGKVGLEPFVLSLRDSGVLLRDLKPSPEFAQFVEANKGMKVYEAVRGGIKCFFLESSLSEGERDAFHKELWDKFRIRSEKSANWDFYRKLNSFWKHAPAVAEFWQQRHSKEGIALVDAQDWLAFPAGFLCRERLKVPLVCRFHSGEFGRSLGKPDADNAVLFIEAAAFQEADFVQGVSISEAKFEAYNLLPLKQSITAELAAVKTQKWAQEQAWRDECFEKFSLLEPEDLSLIAQCVGGITNGIILDDWRNVTPERIKFGRTVLRKLLPEKQKFVLFMGRAEWRKGIDHLLEAFELLRDSSVGLVVSSRLSEDEYRKYYAKIVALGLAKDVVLYNGWVEEDLKKSLFCACDVLALPSLYEPFGLVTLEGLAADLAAELNGFVGPVVVVGGNGGMKEVIRNGVDGFKVPMEREFELKPALLSRILKIALNDEKLRHKISAGGARRVQQKYFSWAYIVERIFEAYSNAQANYATWHGNGDAKPPLDMSAEFLHCRHVAKGVLREALKEAKTKSVSGVKEVKK